MGQGGPCGQWQGCRSEAYYYDFVKFALQKEAEINFDEAKKTRDSTSKPKASSHFCFNHKKLGLPATPAVQIVAPAPEEGSDEGEATSLLSEKSDSNECPRSCPRRHNHFPGQCRDCCQSGPGI